MKSRYFWPVLIVLLAGLFLADLSMGSVSIPFSNLFNVWFSDSVSPVARQIILDFRLPKALTCVGAGAALAVAGLQMQTLFRNPLAGPDVLGLTSGASLAVSLLYMGTAVGVMPFQPSSWTVAAIASAGCIGAFGVMLLVARKLQENASLLIVGLMLGAGTASIVTVLQQASHAEDLRIYILWTLGSVGNLDFEELTILLIMTIAGIAIAIVNLKPLNAWLTGEYYAQSIGININRSRLLIMLSAGLLTGAVTAFCGPITFVGLAVPHLVKLGIQTSNHRTLIPSVAVGGACLLLLCDIVSQFPSTYILPINAITALVGAPVVVWVILRNKTVRM